MRFISHSFLIKSEALLKNWWYIYNNRKGACSGKVHIQCNNMISTNSSGIRYIVIACGHIPLDDCVINHFGLEWHEWFVCIDVVFCVAQQINILIDAFVTYFLLLIFISELITLG